MLRASRDLNGMKIIMGVDRADMVDQLTGTARLIGGKINLVESRAVEQQLAGLIAPAMAASLAAA